MLIIGVRRPPNVRISNTRDSVVSRFRYTWNENYIYLDTTRRIPTRVSYAYTERPSRVADITDIRTMSIDPV